MVSVMMSYMYITVTTLLATSKRLIILSSGSPPFYLYRLHHGKFCETQPAGSAYGIHQPIRPSYHQWAVSRLYSFGYTQNETPSLYSAQFAQRCGPSMQFLWLMLFYCGSLSMGVGSYFEVEHSWKKLGRGGACEWGKWRYCEDRLWPIYYLGPFQETNQDLRMCSGWFCYPIILCFLSYCSVEIFAFWPMPSHPRRSMFWMFDSPLSKISSTASTSGTTTWEPVQLISEAAGGIALRGVAVNTKLLTFSQPFLTWWRLVDPHQSQSLHSM